ncbi:MAG: hypothetical protein OEY40_00890 [Candidatus Bathyarchaeota archaeon]|nr:hypothetical protein [Candidatus Bathyarchaeota archaeon]MDH5595258.1 hypothetical protein [Candidatus Bathyarchaeota archaeon]
MLKKVAHQFWKRGLNIVPLKITKRDKKPLVKWKPWITLRQSEETFNSLPWDSKNCNGFAVILGKLNDGQYYCCFDYDVKHTESQEVRELGRRIMEQLPETRWESTVNGGIHAFYISREDPKTESKYHDISGVELLGTKKLCVMYPSFGYRILRDLEAVQIENANKLLDKVFENHEKEETWFGRSEDSKGKMYRGSDPPCIQKLLDGVPEGERNEIAIRLASYLLNFRQLKRKATVKRLREWNEKNRPSLPENELLSIVKSAEKHHYVYGCNDAVLRVHCNENLCSLFSKRRSVSTMQKTWEMVKHPHVFAYILKDFEQKVKRDLPIKCTALVTCVSAYLKDPLNSYLRGGSGVGKSINVVTVAKYFPERDVMFLLSSSPKALMFEKGVLMDKDGNPIFSTDKPEKPRKGQFPKGDEGSRQFEEAMTEYEKGLDDWNRRLAGSYRLVSLQRKIIVFLEAPSEETMSMLYPILSHDLKRSEYKTVKDMEALKAVVEGYPSMLLLQASRKVRGKVYQEQYMEELITRCLTVSPESSQDKISDANKLTNEEASAPWDYERERESTKAIKDAIVLMRDKFSSGSFDIVVPFGNLHLLYPKEAVRDMRGFDHFIQFLKAFTSFHIFQRPILKRNGKFYVMCSIDDVITVACIFAFIFEQTQTGMEETLLKFYNEIVRKGQEWYVRPLMEHYNALNPKKKVSSDTIRYWMEKLSTVGYVNIRKSETDKRKNIYDPLVTEAEKPEIVRNLENQPVLRSKLRESFEEWLLKKGKEAEFYQYEFSNGKEELSPIELEKVKHSIVKNSFENVPLFLQLIYEQLGVLKSKKQIEEVRKEEKLTISEKSKCDACGYAIEEIPIGVRNVILCLKCYLNYHKQGFSDGQIIKDVEVRKKTDSKAQKLRCDSCDYFIDLSEGKPEIIGEYRICSVCVHDFDVRGYGNDDIIREVKQWKAIRERRMAMTPEISITDSGESKKPRTLYKRIKYEENRELEFYSRDEINKAIDDCKRHHHITKLLSFKEMQELVEEDIFQDIGKQGYCQEILESKITRGTVEKQSRVFMVVEEMGDWFPDWARKKLLGHSLWDVNDARAQYEAGIVFPFFGDFLEFFTFRCKKCGKPIHKGQTVAYKAGGLFHSFCEIVGERDKFEWSKEEEEKLLSRISRAIYNSSPERQRLMEEGRKRFVNWLYKSTKLKKTKSDTEEKSS